MFDRLGKIVDRRWPVILAFWGVVLLGAHGVLHGWINRLGWLPVHVPSWLEVAEDGEFAFLPPEVQSLVGEGLFARAFPEDLLKSSVVIVVRRWQKPLRPEDKEFIEEVLRPRLESIRGDFPDIGAMEVRTSRNPSEGRLLLSQDQEASLVILPLKTEFLERGNEPIIAKVEELLYTELPNQIDPVEKKPYSLIPPGLDLAMSGSATVGRDMLVAADQSAKDTEFWTSVLVIVLLLVIYRFAPIPAAIPLVTVIVAVHIALASLVLLTKAPLLNYRIFIGMQVYITVVVYGAGVDYCLFLIARYKEELDKGLPLRQALSATLVNVGAALTASAFTVICGIGMMVFAQFGKFREAGIGISLGLTVGWLAAMTLTPSLLRLAGRFAFWPFSRWEHIHSPPGRAAGTSLIKRLVERNRVQVQWEHVGHWLLRRPATILITSFLVMLPFAMWGLWNYEYLSYGLLSELPPSKKSVIGAKAVQEHFPAGYAGPLTILIKNDAVDFNEVDGAAALEGLIGHLGSRMAELEIADIRYLKEPLGLHVPLQNNKVAKAAERGRRIRDGAKYYVSSVPGLAGHVTRIDVVSSRDPFDRASIDQLNAIEQTLLASLNSDPDLELLRTSELQFVGPTASIRDLKTVTDHDQIKIDILVLVCVFVILVVLLRKPAISLYLILTVFFSYFVALGVTFVVFQALEGEHFGGLDWKVPMFLFTILMAIGEDYNIFLMTRIEEEQGQHGPIEGIRVAMLKTGTIISSCGIIMAGTFLSLLAGTLVGLKQLGFALAFGVLLDTFVVRPLLVPAYLVLLHQGRFGPLTRFLGGLTPPGSESRSRTTLGRAPRIVAHNSPRVLDPTVSDREGRKN